MSDQSANTIATAMTSLYAAGYPGSFDPGVVEPALQIMPLDEAAQFVVSYLNDADGYWQRNAIVELSDIAWARRPGSTPSAAVDQALSILGAPSVEIQAALAGQQPDSRVEDVVLSVLQAHGMGSNCAKSSTSVGYDVCTHDTVVATKVYRLYREFSDMARVFDPQNWSTCSRWFTASYMAREVKGKYPRDASGTAERAAESPVPGSTWRGVLYEEFDIFAEAIWMKNLFTIETYRTSDLFFYTYDLLESINVKIYWDTIDAGMTRNGGSVCVRKMPDGSVEVNTVKVLKFAPKLGYLNPQARFYLRPMGAQAADMACNCRP